MNKKTWITIFLLSVLTFAGAHEFWLHPSSFFFKRGDKLLVSFKVGENFIGEPWDLKKNRVEKLELHQLSKSINLTDSVKEGDKENLTYALKEEGTLLLTMQSSNAFIELDAEKFNVYLKEDGLDEVLEHRIKTNTNSNAAKEFYSRYTKLLVQVGDKKDDTFKKVVGFPIEIIPDRNPYSLQVGDPIKFKILAKGKPLFGVKVKVWNRFDNRTTIQNIHTEKDGTIEARISNPGPWMVSVVQMVPSEKAEADWQSYWGSLVFGIK
jgi:uncharacterized GH25 family protein